MRPLLFLILILVTPITKADLYILRICGTPEWVIAQSEKHFFIAPMILIKRDKDAARDFLKVFHEMPKDENGHPPTHVIDHEDYSPGSEWNCPEAA